jgi:hypothetical protein
MSPPEKKLIVAAMQNPPPNAPLYDLNANDTLVIAVPQESWPLTIAATMNLMAAFAMYRCRPGPKAKIWLTLVKL